MKTPVLRQTPEKGRTKSTKHCRKRARLTTKDREDIQWVIEHGDFPHLRDNGRWSEPDKNHPHCGSNPRERAAFYFAWLLEQGVDWSETRGLLQDLYWDCFTELNRQGKIVEGHR